jgi:hypothetical protein
MSGIAEVLAAHLYRPGDHGCSCEAMWYDTRRTDEQIMEEHVLHVEMELLEAGFGSVAETGASARKEAVAGLRGWYEERMNEEHAPDVVLTAYEQGREVGITEGILAAALKVNADDPATAGVGPDAASRCQAREERSRMSRRQARPTPTTGQDEAPTYPPDPYWGTDDRGRFRYVDYDGESLVIWHDKDGELWVDKHGEGPVFVRVQDLPVITEAFAAPVRIEG